MKKMNKKGFTLIELLAVIVILGLLMAIAIPSVTKYITQSRKKTLATTIGNYVSALTVAVNNMEYTFTDSSKIYAVPIECIALEKGGTNPFGKWIPDNADDTTKWAYVLVQYDGNDSYTYGFTFKDSAGYAMLPTAIDKMDSKGDDIKTSNSSIVQDPVKDRDEEAIYYSVDWPGFFEFTDEEKNDPVTVVILEAIESGTSDGKTTCKKVQ